MVNDFRKVAVLTVLIKPGITQECQECPLFLRTFINFYQLYENQGPGTEELAQQ